MLQPVPRARSDGRVVSIGIASLMESQPKPSKSDAVNERSSDSPRFDSINLALAVILILALLLRVIGTDWDQGGLYHPDERDFLGRAERLDFSQLGEPGLFDVESRLNPKWFNYGSLPLYVLSGFRALVSPFTESDWNLFDLRFPGRNLAALSDTITVSFRFPSSVTSDR